MRDLVTLGEALLSVRTVGALTPGGAASTHIAGAETNVAIGMARLGHRVAWAGVVGADAPGDAVLRALAAEGVASDLVRRDPTRPTGTMLVEARTADLTRVAYNRTGSAGSGVSYADVRAALDAAPRLLHVTGITPALGPGPAAALTEALARRPALTRACLDVNYRAGLWTRAQARAALAPLADGTAGACVDIVVASADELDLLTEEGTDEAVSVTRLFEAGVSEIVVKRGAEGASWFGSDGERVDLSARPVTVVDAVGAGDALVAGYLSGVLDGLDARGRLARGIDCAAFCVATRGDWEGLPTRAELALLPAPGAEATLR